MAPGGLLPPLLREEAGGQVCLHSPAEKDGDAVAFYSWINTESASSARPYGLQRGRVNPGVGRWRELY